MIEVEFLTPEPGFKRELGRATFTAVPLAESKDFRCYPEGLVPFESAKRIAEKISHNVVVGEINGMEWRLS